MSDAYESGHRNDGIDLWRDFIKYEEADQHTFDPLSTIALMYSPDQKPPGDFEDWESYYAENYTEMIDIFLISADKLKDDDPDRITFVLAAVRIGETLPENVEKGSYGSKGYVIDKVFWHYFERKDYADCLDYMPQALEWCSDKQLEHIRYAIKNPKKYIELRRTWDEE